MRFLAQFPSILNKKKWFSFTATQYCKNQNSAQGPKLVESFQLTFSAATTWSYIYLWKLFVIVSINFDDWRLYSVSNRSESESALFRAKKQQKAPQNFFFKKRHNFGQRRHNLRYFLLCMKLKWPTKSFLLHFYVTISPRAMQNCETTQILIFFLSKWWKIGFFYAPQKFFRATRKSQSATLAQKRHF